jgi:hypothetical protein
MSRAVSRKVLSRQQLHRAAGEGFQPDFRAPGVQHGRHREVQFLPQLFQLVQTGLMLVVAAVGEIKTRHTFMPARSISRRTPSRSVAGPRVQTILVFLMVIPPFLIFQKAPVRADFRRGTGGTAGLSLL